MKRILAVYLTAALLISAVSAQTSSPPTLSAASTVLVDGESGRVLFAQNAREERSIASITKLMTALVAAESAVDLQGEVIIRPEWTEIEGSSIYLRTGEKIPLETLLYGLLLNSGNDAAVAVAAHCAGTVEAFVERMNTRAKELGMEQTHFTNPNGLSQNGHYSTAYDMALLAQACLKNETVAKIVKTRSITLGTRSFTNHNKLLWRYEGCIGMKTGYTEQAGRTLVSAARRDGQTLIAVTLHAPNDWADHEALFDYGFEQFARQTFCAAGETVGRIPVRGGLVPFASVITAESVSASLSADEAVRTKVTLPDWLEAPVTGGMVLGKLSFYLGDALLGETELLASAVHRDAAEQSGLWERLCDRLLT